MCFYLLFCVCICVNWASKAQGHIRRMAVVELNRGQYSIFREVKQDAGVGHFAVLS